MLVTGEMMAKLEKIATFNGYMKVEGMGDLAVLVPLETKDFHFMDFDRVVCASGLKKYVRRITESDMESMPGEQAKAFRYEKHIIVIEEEPGQRLRILIGHKPPDPFSKMAPSSN